MRGKKEEKKEAMAGTYPAFDLFKWVDRLSHESAICFSREIFSYINPVDFAAKVIAYFPPYSTQDILESGFNGRNSQHRNIDFR